MIWIMSFMVVKTNISNIVGDVTGTLDVLLRLVSAHTKIEHLECRGLRVRVSESDADVWQASAVLLMVLMKEREACEWLLSKGTEAVNIIPHLAGLTCEDMQGNIEGLWQEHVVSLSVSLEALANAIVEAGRNVTPSVLDAICSATFECMERFSYTGSWESELSSQKAASINLNAICVLSARPDCLELLLRLGAAELVSAHAFSSFHFCIGDDLSGAFFDKLTKFSPSVVKAQCKLLHQSCRTLGYLALYSDGRKNGIASNRLKSIRVLLRRIVRPFELCELEMLEAFDDLCSSGAERSAFVAETYAACDLYMLSCVKNEKSSTIPRGRSAILRATEACASIAAGTANSTPPSSRSAFSPLG